MLFQTFINDCVLWNIKKICNIYETLYGEKSTETFLKICSFVSQKQSKSCKQVSNDTMVSKWLLFYFCVKSFILCCSILSFWMQFFFYLDVLQPFHVGNAQCPSTMVIGYHARSLVLLWPIVRFSLCHCRWTIALTEGPHRCSLHLMNSNLSTPPPPPSIYLPPQHPLPSAPARNHCCPLFTSSIVDGIDFQWGK